MGDNKFRRSGFSLSAQVASPPLRYSVENSQHAGANRRPQLIVTHFCYRRYVMFDLLNIAWAVACLS